MYLLGLTGIKGCKKSSSAAFSKYLFVGECMVGDYFAVSVIGFRVHSRTHAEICGRVHSLLFRGCDNERVTSANIMR